MDSVSPDAHAFCPVYRRCKTTGAVAPAQHQPGEALIQLGVHSRVQRQINHLLFTVESLLGWCSIFCKGNGFFVEASNRKKQGELGLGEKQPHSRALPAAAASTYLLPGGAWSSFGPLCTSLWGKKLALLLRKKSLHPSHHPSITSQP